MAVTDRKISRDARSARKTFMPSLISAVSQTRLPWFIHRPGYNFVITDAELFCSAYTAVLSSDVLIVGADAIITKGTVQLSAVFEKYKTTTVMWWLTGGLLKTKAATDNLTFGTPYTVNNALGAGLAHWGAFLLQVSAAGVSTAKAVSQDQDFATQAAAVQHLPAPDAGKTPYAYIAIQSKAGTRWTADTDDMSGGSDCNAALFFDLPQPASIFNAAMPAFAMGNQYPALNADPKKLRGSASQSLVGIYTSDGAGALTGGKLSVTLRPNNMAGDGGLGS